MSKLEEKLNIKLQQELDALQKKIDDQIEQSELRMTEYVDEREKLIRA